MKTRIAIRPPQKDQTEATHSELAHPTATSVLLRVVLPAAIVVGLVGWALSGTRVPLPTAPVGAPLVLAAISFTVVGVMRWFRHRFGIAPALVGELPDPLFTMYLAMVILVGMPAGVLLAVVTPILESVPEAVQRRLDAALTLRQTAAAAATTFLAGAVYLAVSALSLGWLSSVRAHFAGAIVASLVMFAGLAVSRMLELRTQPGSNGAVWRHYLGSPAVRFQALLLSIGPLLPLAELLDDVEAEFAWVLFLVPLFAVYYLALISVRLQQRTDELQVTVQQLGVARRREAELSDYAALITQAQEDERRRLARDLHDDTAQALIALSRGLDALASRHVEPPLSTIDTRFIGELGELANRTLESVRRACQDLRPSVLDDLGLAAALESLAQSVTQRGLMCSYRQVGDDRTLPPEVEVTAYRIAQEALSNARQHAAATAAALDVAYLADRLELSVTDNGQGFDMGAHVTAFAASSHQPPEARAGLGLIGMRERAGLIGARLAVETKIGKGTTVRLVVPIRGA